MTSPALLISLPLRWKNKLLGTLWLASDRQEELGEEKLSYFIDLSQKAATAIVNHKAFDDSLTQRKQLEAVLAALDDAVIVTDRMDHHLCQPCSSIAAGVGRKAALGVSLARALGEGVFSAVSDVPLVNR